jgi:hypothetical protein
MVLSSLGYSLQSGNGGNGTTKIKYNGYDFVITDGFWTTDTGSLKLSLMYSPREMENISASVKPLSNYYNKPLYIYSEDSSAEQEVTRNIGGVVQRIQRACIKNEPCEGNSPIKSCEDNIIIIKRDGKTEIKQDNNCVYIHGTEENIVKNADLFLLKTMGITQ